MLQRAHSGQKRSARPALDPLESRELLSTASVHAEISALRVQSHAHVSILGQLPVAPSRTASTTPANGDQNPYGVAFVPNGVAKGGVLQPGDLLVSNFNNGTPAGNLQGTGTTIVRVAADNTRSVFYQGPPGSGFGNGLAVLKNGYVIAGTVPSTDGTPATVGRGEVLVLNKNGAVVSQCSDPKLLNGPWSLTAVDQGSHAVVFVSNVLSGTVSRFNVSMPASGGVQVKSATQIGSGFLHRGDPAAFEIGPGGLAYDSGTGNLYVASGADDSIYVIRDALHTKLDRGTGRLVVHDEAHLHDPVGLALASDGHLIAANADGNNANPADPSTLVEYTRGGRFVHNFSLNPANGAAFGVAITRGPRPFLAAVNDVNGTATVWQVHGTHPIAPAPLTPTPAPPVLFGNA